MCNDEQAYTALITHLVAWGQYACWLKIMGRVKHSPFSKTTSNKMATLKKTYFNHPNGYMQRIIYTINKTSNEFGVKINLK